jgi:hypothetical protein
MSSLIYDDVRGALKCFLGMFYLSFSRSHPVGEVVRDAATYAEHRRRRTISLMDVLLALKRRGTTLYFTERFSYH